MHPALLIAAKDLRQRLRDASAIVMALVLPLALAVILSLVLGEATGQDMSFRYALVDSDHGAAARSFRDDVLAAVEREGLIKVTAAASEPAARQLVDRGKVAAAIVVPAGFSAAVQRGGTPQLLVLGDVDQQLATELARSLADGFAQRLNGTRLAVATVAHTGARQPQPAALDALVERASRMASPVALRDLPASSRELDAKTYFAAGMAVFFVFFTVQFGVSSLLEERKDGTLARLLAAPVRRGAILSVLIVASGLLLGAHWGNPVGVGLLVVAGVLSALAIMALVATIARTSEQAGNWQAIIALLLGMFGGSFFSLSQAGGLFAKVSLLTPHAWFLRGLGELAGGAGPAAVLPSVLAMLAFAVVTGSVALLRLGRFARP
jgi:ABC-2 type transport system permease protein